MQHRRVGNSGLRISRLGLGTMTYGTAVDDIDAEELIVTFLEAGGTLIDTAPTYGNAEDNLGPLLTEGGHLKKAWIATKLSGVNGRDEGMKQFAGTLKSLKTDKVQLLQVHNLGDTKTQLEVARELKKLGKVRYVGVTHYTDSAHDDIAEVVKTYKPDFLQINHSVTNRGIEQKVLPVAKESGVAVITNRNFNDGALFSKVKTVELPGWAAEAGITSWAQAFLKYSLSFEEVTAVIPATGKPERQADNLKAGMGPLLTAKQRKELVELVG
jgi:aryl-alcohol dehydrogenase-like predicted oxidoreductase